MEIHKHRILRNAIRILLGKKYLERFYNKHKTNHKTYYTLSFDLDFKSDVLMIPWLLKQLKKHDLKADFACVGKYIEEYPEYHALIIKDGHEIVNHSYSHPWNEETNPTGRWDKLDDLAQEKEIMLCHKACLDKLGYTPIGFRIPHFGAQFTPSIYSILKKIGYIYDSSKISLHAGNPNPYSLEITSGITEFPMSSCPLHPFDLFDTWHSLNRGPKHHNSPGEFYGMFLELVKMAEKNGAYVNFYIDPQDVQDNTDFIKMLKYLQTNKEMVKTYRELLTLC